MLKCANHADDNENVRIRAWGLWLWLVALATLVYVLAPSSVSAEVGFVALYVTCAAALTAGAVRLPSSVRSGWPMLAAAAWLLTAGELAWFAQDRLGLDPFPSVADAFYLSGYVPLTAGLVVMARHRTMRRDLSSLLDAAIVAVAAGVLAWVHLIEPYASDTSLSFVEKLFSVAYPAMDLALLAVAVRLVFAAGARSTPFRLLVGGLAFLLAADIGFGLLELRGTYQVGGPVDGGWILAWALLASAVWHPGAREASHLDSANVVATGTVRVVIVCLSWLIVPAAVILSPDASGRLVTAVASAVMFGLVVARLVTLTRTVAQLAERRGESRLSALVENSTDLIVIVDREGTVSYSSPAAARVLLRSPEALVGSSFTQSIVLDDRAVVVRSLEACAAGGHDSVAFETRVVRSDDAVRDVEIVGVNLLDDPTVEGLVLTVRDVTERRRLERELSRRAFHDPLTGLANRALFEDRTSHSLSRRRHDDPSLIGVLFIDLDDFKAVNDGLGHRAGDELLVDVGRRIESAVRAGDTAARLGGDEFAVLLDPVGDESEALEVGHRVLQALREAMLLSGIDIDVSGSVGLALAHPGDDAEALLRDADLALYDAKAGGKNQLSIFSPSMHEQALATLHMKADLARALEVDELFCEYQPVVDLTTGVIIGAEALVRWLHPEQGLVPPLAFIPLAERSSLILGIGEFVLRRACQEAATWPAPDGGRPAPWISVNVSSAQLSCPDFAAHVAAALDDSGLAPERLVLELTESLVVADLDLAVPTMTELRALGVRIVIDDFGTGFSSLAYLQALPVDGVKIDRSFVTSLEAGDRQAAVTRAILDLATNLGITTVAEGIEEWHQVDRLLRLGCHRGQGFLYARPMRAADIAATVSSGQSLGRRTIGV